MADRGENEQSLVFLLMIHENLTSDKEIQMIALTFLVSQPLQSAVEEELDSFVQMERIDEPGSSTYDEAMVRSLKVSMEPKYRVCCRFYSWLCALLFFCAKNCAKFAGFLCPLPLCVATLLLWVAVHSDTISGVSFWLGKFETNLHPPR